MSTGYALIVPGLVVAGIGQGIVWMAATSAVAHHEQGITSGKVSTTLSMGSAIGLAGLVALTNAALSGFTSELLRSHLAQGVRQAFYLAAAGMALGLLIALAWSRKAANIAQSGEAV
ncbi:TPA: hypothetical protein ACTXAA_004143 [Raoultella planticola]